MNEEIDKLNPNKIEKSFINVQIVEIMIIKKYLMFLILFIYIFILIGILIYKFCIKKELEYEEFNDKINEKYIQLQNHFCEKENENINQTYDDKLIIANASLNGTNFNMYVYKKNDIVSNNIIKLHYWEKNHTMKILKAMQYYAQKKNLENKDIYLLDIGANVGWFTYFIGKYGFKIISFEASKINGYILYKNYCLNKDVKVTLINKGLDTEDKKCKLQIARNNNGNGMIMCENRDKSYIDFNGEIFNDIELTKLSKYIKFLSEQNLAFMKIDVEGAEGTIIKGGKEIISEYHIPFIAMEYNKKMIESHGVNATEFLLFIENNGYKFSLIDFFSQQYISALELTKKHNILNLFIVHEKILE